jgi:hypothetical protein
MHCSPVNALRRTGVRFWFIIEACQFTASALPLYALLLDRMEGPRLWLVPNTEEEELYVAY